jgi:hypothetical protein
MRIKMLLVLAVLLGSACFAQGPSFPYSANFGWTLSTGATTGQNMYRGVFTTACPPVSGYTKLTTTPLPPAATSYSDATVTQGSYCYFVTAVGAQGESGPSNIVSNVLIPPPPPTGFGATVADVDSVPETTFAWKQSTGVGVTGNRVYCKTAKTPFVVLVATTAPVDLLRMKQGRSSTYICEGTAFTSKIESGPSNQFTFMVN